MFKVKHVFNGSALLISILFLGACTSQLQRSNIAISQINGLQLGQDVTVEKTLFPKKKPTGSYLFESQNQHFLANTYNLIVSYNSHTMTTPITSCMGTPPMCSTRYTTTTVTTPVLENFALIYKIETDITTLLTWGKFEELVKSEDAKIATIMPDLKQAMQNPKTLSK